MSMPRFSADAGFTLIEIIVSVTILLLLTSLLVAGYSRFNNAQVVQQASATFKNNIRLVRTAAASGVKPVGCDSLVGYVVDFPTVASYTSSALCMVGGVQESVGMITSYTLANGVQFAWLPPDITFSALNQGSATPQTLTLTGNGTSITLSVSAAGVVEDFIPTPTP